MKKYIINNRKKILFVLLYIALFRFGIEIYNLSISSTKTLSYIDLSGLIASLLLSIGCFWEIYFTKGKKMIFFEE